MPDNDIQLELRRAIRHLADAVHMLDRKYEQEGTDNRIASIVIQGVMSILENIKSRIG